MIVLLPKVITKLTQGYQIILDYIRPIVWKLQLNCLPFYATLFSRVKIWFLFPSLTPDKICWTPDEFKRVTPYNNILCCEIVLRTSFIIRKGPYYQLVLLNLYKLMCSLF